MSIDLMGMFKDAVGQQIKGKLAGMLGTDEDKASGAFEAASASILGGLMKKAAGGGEGQKQIFEAAQGADTGMLDKLGDLLGGGQQTEELQKQGGGILDMVFGGNSGGIISTITKALGLGEGKGGMLMSLVAPLLMSFIGKQIKAKAMDMTGFGNMLSDQKSHLAGHLPSALSGQLGLGNFMEDAGKTVSGARESFSNAAGDAVESGGSAMKFLLPLLLLGLGALAIWYFGFRNPAATPDHSLNSPTGGSPGISAPPSFGDIEGVDMGALGETGTKLASGFSSITTALGAATDEEKATSAVGKLKEFGESIGGMGLGDLEGPAKSSASTMIGKFIETVKGMIDGIENETVKKLLGPAVDGLMEKLKPFVS